MDVIASLLLDIRWPWEDPQLFGEQVVSGLATGGIYALLALALVLIYRSTDVVNFAQGEMAMFSTYIIWSIAGPESFDRMPIWTLFLIAVPVGMALGGLIERIVIRPVEGAPVLNIIVVTLGLFIVLNAVATGIYTKGEPTKVFPTPFGFESVDLGFASISQHSLGTLAIGLAVMVTLYLLFNRTKIGLAMRATALNPTASRLMGINVGTMLTLGWALSAGVGAIAGTLIAPVTLLHPGFMQFVLLYAFAAAVLGGLNSPVGAVVGGFLIGVAENLFGTYTPEEWLGAEMKLPLTLLLLVLVLLIKPTGLFGQATTRRV
jgi:branched-chain amino acid transport system permease protein